LSRKRGKREGEGREEKVVVTITKGVGKHRVERKGKRKKIFVTEEEAAYAPAHRNKKRGGDSVGREKRGEQGKSKSCATKKEGGCCS